MKKSFVLSLLCAVASFLPAQKEMYIWQDASSSVFPVSVVDSVTFSASARLHVWSNNTYTDFAYAAIDSITFAETPFHALQGVFSVSETKQVQFSTGNLQYTQSTRTWSFAAQQYEILGTDNVDGGDVTHNAISGDSKSGTALADKIDLFCWSGSTGTAQWGIGISTDYNDYSGDFADWGQNIGDGETWRTLTNDEWYYLLNTRTNASSLMGVARITLSEDGTKYANGLILLPDNRTVPEGVTFKSGSASSYSVQAYADYQTFTLDQWSKLEQVGAVFLPASGYYYGSDVSRVQGRALYWSATPDDACCARYLYFGSGGANMDYYGRYGGQAVRLVKTVDAEPEPEPEPAPLNGVFSVSETKQVRFSAGNLQYTQSTATWSFAGHQYDFIGKANIEEGALADKIDLFGWSGSTGSAKWGISTSTDNSDYAGDFADWGKNLSDGRTWRTLSSDEWRYLFEYRANAGNLWSRGSVNGINGLIILPDNFGQPADLTWTAQANNWTTNAYNLTQWAVLESLGAVFLPAAGRRSGGETMYNVQDYGYYWSSSSYNTSAYHIQFLVSNFFPEYLNGRCNGNSVRLVQDL